MIFGSVCSGIEAATVAWEPLGFKSAFYSEIEKFPRQVLSHHYPDVPLHGDFTTIKERDYEPVDLLVGGTPCQSFSVAGLRKGLSDERGNLSLEFIRLAERLKSRWILWENVPGVLSIDGGRAFGSFIGGLAECGYGFAYRILDAQYFGVPQRRRRVFVVGYLGDWRPAAAVLFEREGLRGDITPRREAGKSVAGAIAKCSFTGGAGGRPEGAAVGHFIESFGIDCEHNAHAIDGPTGPLLKGSPTGGGHQLPAVMVPDTAWCLQERDAKGPDSDTKEGHLIPVVYPINTQIATRHEALGEGTGMGIGSKDDPAFTLQARHSHAVGCFKGGQDEKAGGIGYDENLSPTLGAADSGTNRTPALMQGMQVRRLTPRECERLQGFPDDYTKITDKTADGPRYKALGNSMAVPVMKWLGQRIQMVNGILHP